MSSMVNLPKKLRPYQIKKGIHYLRKNMGGCLFWEMRLGKTLTAIRYLSQVSKRTLIVGPYSVLFGWMEELEGKPIYLIDGCTSARNDMLDQLQESPGWFLINKEAHLRIDFLQYHWDAIVIDECFITNPKAEVTKYFLKYTKAKIRILLTGTPAPEGEDQYYSPLRWINPRIINYKTFYHFKLARFRMEGFEYVMSVKNKRWLAGQLNKYCSVLKRKDVGLQKEKIYQIRKITLTKENRRIYDTIERDAMLGDEVLKYSAERRNAMRRLCSGKEKIDELKYLLNGELKHHKVIVYAWFVDEVIGLAKELRCPAIYGDIPVKQRDKTRLAFQEGIVSRLVIQPETIKYGSCFSMADMAIFFSRPESLLTNQQVEERTEDLSTPESTFILDIVAKDTIEEDILLSIKNKESRVQALERIRRGIETRLQETF
jgi:SNF2 family DNA or RNA helicase